MLRCEIISLAVSFMSIYASKVRPWVYKNLKGAKTHNDNPWREAELAQALCGHTCCTIEVSSGACSAFSGACIEREGDIRNGRRPAAPNVFCMLPPAQAPATELVT
jgi:hypothetical protein